MPELPEVETSRRGVEPYLVGQTFIGSVIRQPRLRWPVSPEISTLYDQQIISVQRRAKYLLLEVTHGWIIIHLGMSGSVRILPATVEPQKHDHIDLLLSSGKILRYTDPRRFGAWLWSNSLSTCNLLAHLGPEPLSTAFSTDYLMQRSRNKLTLIKPWIMNNRVVVGVGNIYASESLFTAGIHPQRLAGSLQQVETERLIVAIKQVLSRAIEQGGTTLRDFLQSDGKPGYFTQQLQVYGRKGEACFSCGHEVQSVKLAQRNTFYCPQCQQ